MPSKREYVAEILDKKSRLLKRGKAFDQCLRRLYPVVAAFRYARKSRIDADIKNELLKYGAIG